jgi:hypothetical protein
MMAPGIMAPIEVRLGRDRADIDAGTGRARARHVLTAIVGLPECDRQMARNRASIDVVAAAGIAADHKLDGLAGIVVDGGRGPRDERGAGDCGEQFGCSCHDRHGLIRMV